MSHILPIRANAKKAKKNKNDKSIKGQKDKSKLSTFRPFLYYFGTINRWRRWPLSPWLWSGTRGQHKARVTSFWGGSSELFNPQKHKKTRRTQNGIPFQMSPCCCLFPCCVYMTLFTACPEAIRGANMWGAGIRRCSKDNNCNFSFFWTHNFPQKKVITEANHADLTVNV